MPETDVTPDLEAMARRVAALYPDCGLLVECPAEGLHRYEHPDYVQGRCPDCHGTGSVLRPVTEWLEVLVRETILHYRVNITQKDGGLVHVVLRKWHGKNRLQHQAHGEVKEALLRALIAAKEGPDA